MKRIKMMLVAMVAVCAIGAVGASAASAGTVTGTIAGTGPFGSSIGPCSFTGTTSANPPSSPFTISGITIASAPGCDPATISVSNINATYSSSPSHTVTLQTGWSVSGDVGSPVNRRCRCTFTPGSNIALTGASTALGAYAGGGSATASGGGLCFLIGSVTLNVSNVNFS
jgi:hypothetical protein